MQSSEIPQIGKTPRRTEPPARSGPDRPTAAAEPAIDLDRLTWHLDYRAEVRVILKTENVKRV